MTESTSERVCPATHLLMCFLKEELRISEEALLTYSAGGWAHVFHSLQSGLECGTPQRGFYVGDERLLCSRATIHLMGRPRS